MGNEQLRVIKLEPMRMASAWAFGPQPEPLAWQQLQAWAQARGIPLADGQIFGFNNPNPSPGSPNYGYEFWLAVGPTVEPAAGDDVRIVNFAGGLYAMIEVDVAGDLNESIPAAWRTLDAQVAASAYHTGAHQWLEQHTAEGMPYAFYYPIVG